MAAVTRLLLFAVLVWGARGGDDDGMKEEKLPPAYDPASYPSPAHNHLLHFQEDVNEWKFETTQNLQRPFMQQLYETSKQLYEDPYDAKSYVDLREQLNSHCNRVYNQTCEWQFSPPYNPRNHVEREEGTSTNAAIVYLCCADAQEFQDFLWSLKFLDLNFNNEFKYPVLIFHENFGTAQFNMIRQMSQSNISFHKVNLQVPRFLDLQQVPRWYKGFSLGFRNMIRFHAIELYEHPAMQHFDYYWRLDSDSFILGRLWVDPFEFMRINDYKYGFIATMTEKEDFIQDLWELHEAHRRSEGIVSEWFKGKWNGFGFYTNCEIARRDFWQLPQVASYLKRIDREGGIYKSRWSEATIHFLATTLFLASQELLQIVFLPYWHQNLVILPQPWSETDQTNPDGTAKARQDRQEPRS